MDKLESVHYNIPKLYDKIFFSFVYSNATFLAIVSQNPIKENTYYFPKFLSALIPNGILIANVVISEIGWVSSKPVSPK